MDLSLLLCITLCVFLIYLIYIIFNLRLKIKNKKKKIKLILFQFRIKKILSFEIITENILRDILDALKEYSGSYDHVQSILPLLSDIRKHGDKLLSQRKFYHGIFFSDCEKRLDYKIHRLKRVELFLKSLGRHEIGIQKLNFGDESKGDFLYEK